MSIAAISWALKVKTGSPTAKLVLIKLADNANDDGMCWPSIRHISEQTELSERAVREHIKTLVGIGFVRIEKRYSEGVQLPNVYHLELRQTVGVVHQVQGVGAGDAPGVVHQVQGNSKPSDLNRHSNRSGPADAEPLPTRSLEIAPQPFLELPTNRNGEEYLVTEAEVLEYEALFQAVDVRAQIRKMRAWLNANPENRKTMKGVPKFINRWLSKEQDKGPINGSNTSSRNGKPRGSHQNFIAGGLLAIVEAGGGQAGVFDPGDDPKILTIAGSS